MGFFSYIIIYIFLFMEFRDEELVRGMVMDIMGSEYIDIVSGVGLIFNGNIIYDRNFSYITEYDEYDKIVKKIMLIIDLVNDNPEFVDYDLMDELWYMV